MAEDPNYDELGLKEIDREKKVRKKKNYLVRFLIVVGVLVGGALFLSSSLFSINTVQVTGNSYYSDQEVINMAAAKASGNIFWGTGSSEIKDRLMEDPYFADVKVRRKLPHTLVIDVTERKQIAAIVYGSDYIVIDEDGTVLRKTDIDPKVTLITGLTLSKLTVGESVGVEEKETLKLTLKMLGAMDDGDIYFKKINVSNVTIKAYIFDTLIVQGTPKEMIKVIKDGDLAKVVNNLLENDTKRGTISIGDHNYMAFSPDF